MAENNHIAALRVKFQQAEGLGLRRVSKWFGKNSDTPADGSHYQVLNNIDFSLTKGTIIGLVGKTGVGKTTLGKILAGLLRPDNGSAAIGDENISRSSDREVRLIRQWIRFVPQNPDAVLPETITVSQALEEARQNTRLSESDLGQWLEMIKSDILLDPAWNNRQVGDLSLGQRRRVVNCRSLQSCPKFLIMDEPFNGLDFISKDCMLELLQEISSKKEIGILIISHDVEALEQICRDIRLLDAGDLKKYQRKST